MEPWVLQQLLVNGILSLMLRTLVCNEMGTELQATFFSEYAAMDVDSLKERTRKLCMHKIFSTNGGGRHTGCEMGNSSNKHK